jgi:hypothetical protein
MEVQKLLFLSLILSLFMIGLIAGCKDNGSEPAAPGLTPSYYDTKIQPIFTNNCTSRSCHPGGGAPFSLATGSSYSNLVNVLASNGSGSCPQAVYRVRPGSADSSVLYKRIEGLCGLNQMPLGSTQLTSADRDTIEAWINRGAPRN